MSETFRMVPATTGSMVWKVVCVPTKAGVSLMLSVPDTAKFIQALKKITAQ